MPSWELLEPRSSFSGWPITLTLFFKMNRSTGHIAHIQTTSAQTAFPSLARTTIGHALQLLLSSSMPMVGPSHSAASKMRNSPEA